MIRRRGPVDPGSEAQIDYGRLGMWFDPSAARRVAVGAFVMVLSCSRHLFVRPVIRMDQTTWCACHVAAFEFFGAVPARLVCDNLKTGVDKPDLYDPQINRTYAELAVHYGTLRDWPQRSGGCRPKDSRRPGAHHRPRGQEGALPGRVLLRCNTTTPLGSGGSTAGRPTVRKVELPSGRRMTQEANADSRNGDRKPGKCVTGTSAGWIPHNWSDTGGCPARKGADVGRVRL